MKMNRLERVLMNSAVRGLFLRWFEAPLLKTLGGHLEGSRVLEVGCGLGLGTELLLTRFEAMHVSAVDLDEDQVQRARRRLSRFGPQSTLR